MSTNNIIIDTNNKELISIAKHKLVDFLIQQHIMSDNVLVEANEDSIVIQAHGKTSQPRNQKKLFRAFINYIDNYNNTASQNYQLKMWGLYSYNYFNFTSIYVSVYF